ncbi:MAG: redox-sensing transcriptional repressor Rex [Bacteroidales bacterium]|jgi:redox-sensing transcriptional repressor|nr:redox-sensing transcriptional repressor Rex [Bacteroidales bacterium]
MESLCIFATENTGTLDSKKNKNGKEIMGVPEPTIRRMPSYLNLLKEMKETEVSNVSAPQIGQRLGLDSTQVVKDLAYAGASGRPRIGYGVEDLLVNLKNLLGYNRQREAFLVGAGSLGQALIQYDGFVEHSMRIVAAFDTDPTKVGKEFRNVSIFHIDKYRDLADRLHIPIGIITTPASVAQEIADMMISWGIKAIWNFAPVALKIPQHVILQDTHIYANLAVILNKLTDKEKTVEQ